MAIVWGGWLNHLRVGIDVWTDGYNTYTPSINIYVAVHVQCDGSFNFNDRQMIRLRGSVFGGDIGEVARDWWFDNNLGPNQSMHIGTAQVSGQQQSYGGGPGYGFNAALLDVYLGGGPSTDVGFSLPARPGRPPAAPSGPVYSSLTSSSVHVTWGTTPDNGGAAPDLDTFHLAVDPNFQYIIRDEGAVGNHRDITGLSPGTTYWGRAYIHNAYGWSAPSAVGAFTTAIRATTAPGTPQFSNITPTGFYVAWPQPTDMGGSLPSKYALQIANDAAFTSMVYAQEVTGYLAINGVAPGKRYYVRVAAINGAGASGWSPTGVVDSAIRATSAPGAPTFSGVTSTGFTVGWSAPTDNGGSTPTSYRLQVATDSAFSTLVYDQSANNRSRTLSGLAAGKTHYARVLAVNGAGNSSWSAVSSTGTGATVASAPGTPAWSDVTPTTANLAWADSTSNGGAAPTGYRLVIATDTGFTNVVHDSTALTRTRAVTGLAPGTQYYARALTVNSVGSSAWSGSGPASTGAFATSGVSVTSVSPDSAKVSWATPTGATPTGYQVQYSTSADFTTGVQTVTSATWATERTVTGLTPATNYFMRVRSNTASGYGAWSSAVSLQTLSGAKVRVGGQWVDGVAYVRQGGQWVVAKVYKRKDGAWVL